MKITKPQQKLHDKATELIYSIEPGKHGREFLPCPGCNGREDGCDLFGCNEGRMSAADYIFHNWLPAAEHSIGKGAIFFTPPQFAVSVCQATGCGGRLVEPTAGIGVLAYRMQRMAEWHTPCNLHITCIEQQPKFVEIGKRLVPAAEWHCGDVFDILPKLAKFDAGFGNPPFGNVPTIKGIAHYAIADLLIKHTKHGGTLIVPKQATNRQGDKDDSWDANGLRRNLKPDERYLNWAKRNPGWSLTPTAWEGPEIFKGATCACHIAELCYDEGQFERTVEREDFEQPEPAVSLDIPKPRAKKPAAPVVFEQTMLL